MVCIQYNSVKYNLKHLTIIGEESYTYSPFKTTGNQFADKVKIFSNRIKYHIAEGHCIEWIYN